MVKKLKSILILVLGLVFSLSCLSMCILAQKAFADNSSFYIEGAAFRIPASTEENFGIKFKAHIDSITYGNAKDNDATFGILIVPEDLKGDNAQIKDISGLIPEEENGEYVFSGAVYDILWSNVTRPFTAKAYYKVGNNYTYADGENWFDSRTLFTMATQALVENDEQYESYTENFNTIINYALDRGYVESGFTVNTEDAKILGVGTTFTVTGSVKNSANESKVLAAYPVVTVTDSEGTPINGIIELVDGTQNTYKVIGKAENATIKMQVGTSANAIVKTFEGYSFRDEGAVAGVSGAYAKNATLTVNNGEITNITLMGNEVSASVDSYSYVGFESGFGVGETLAINWHGQIMPGIGLFLDDAPTGSVIGGLVDGGSGIYYANNSYWGTPYRYIAAGPYRYISNDANKATSRVDNLTHFGPVFPDSAEMGYANLNSDKDYRLEITIVSADSNQAALAFTFYEVAGNGALTKVTTFNKTSTLADVNYNSTTFAFYGYNRASVAHSFSYELYNNNVESKVVGVDGAYAKKATIEKADGKINRVTFEATANDLLYNTQEDNVPYVGFENGFGVGKTLAVEFTGKDLPVIGLFLGDAPEGTVIGGLKDAGTGIVFVNANPLWSLGRYIGVGPYRLLSSDSTKTTNRVDNITYMGTDGTNASAEMGYNNLVEGTDYRFELTITAADESTNTATITGTLYIVNEDGTLTQNGTFTKTTPASLADVNYDSTAFAFYGLIRPEYGGVTFSYEVYDNNEEHEILGVDGAYAKKAQVAKKDGKITSITLEKTPNDFISPNAVDNVAYVGFESGFGAGKTLAIEFTGKNLPLLGLFLDDAPEGTVIGGLKNAGTGLIYTNNNANWSINRYICAGPNRLYNDNDGGDTRIYSYMGPSGTENAEMGIGKLDASTDYRFEISIISANEETNSAEIKFTLYTVDEEDALTQVSTFTQELSASSTNNATTSATAVNYNSTAFAFYGAQRPEFGTLTFSFELYDTPQA